MPGESRIQNLKKPHSTYAEQSSVPDTPDAGHQRLFIDEADHHLKRVDEDDVVVDLEGAGSSIDDTAYNATTWNGDTTHAPSKNAVRDKIESMGSPDFPVAVAFFVDEVTKTVGNAFTLTLDALERYGWWQYQNAAANGDSWEKSIFLKAGTYTISVLGMTAPSRGIQEIFIDGVSVGTIDWYNGSLVYNQVKTISSVTVTGDGQHTFKSTVNGKNGSSSDYQLLLTKVWMK
jgi:hypothetical protein